MTIDQNMYRYTRTLYDGSCSAAVAVVCTSQYFCMVIASAHHMLQHAALAICSGRPCVNRAASTSSIIAGRSLLAVVAPYCSLVKTALL